MDNVTVKAKRTKGSGKADVKKNVFEPEVALRDAIQSSGKTYLLRHFSAGRLSASQAIIAKCCECNGYWIDGREDCKMPKCPLYPWMPYRKKAGVSDAKE